MDGDWQELRIKIAELTALVHEARTRPLSDEEATRLSVAVETVIAVKAELRKKRPSLKRVRKQVAKAVARLARDQRSESNR